MFSEWPPKGGYNGARLRAFALTLAHGNADAERRMLAVVGRRSIGGEHVDAFLRLRCPAHCDPGRMRAVGALLINARAAFGDRFNPERLLAVSAVVAHAPDSVAEWMALDGSQLARLCDQPRAVRALGYLRTAKLQPPNDPGGRFGSHLAHVARTTMDAHPAPAL